MEYVRSGAIAGLWGLIVSAILSTSMGLLLKLFAGDDITAGGYAIGLITMTLSFSLVTVPVAVVLGLVKVMIHSAARESHGPEWEIPMTGAGGIAARPRRCEAAGRPPRGGTGRPRSAGRKR